MPASRKQAKSRQTTGVLCSAALLLALATPALADDPPPKRKPGLWEIATGAVVTRMCVKGTEEVPDAETTERMRRQCPTYEGHYRDGAYILDSVCLLGEITRTQHMEMTFIGDEAFRSESTVRFTPAFPGNGDGATTVMTGRWLGACGGLRPGQMQLNGRIYGEGAPP